jgi:hypothetical protein
MSTNEGSLYGITEQLYFRLQGLGGKYSDPEFVWSTPAVPTGIAFLDSDKLGKGYRGDLLVGSFKYGAIYDFDLNADRTSLELDGALADKIENSPDASDDIILGRNFGPITDLEVGPDGYLYVLSLDGRLYRILTVAQAAAVVPELPETGIPLLLGAVFAATISYAWVIRKRQKG